MKKSSISRFNNNLSTMFIVDESNNEIKAYELEPEYKELTGGGSSDLVVYIPQQTTESGGGSLTDVDFSSITEETDVVFEFYVSAMGALFATSAHYDPASPSGFTSPTGTITTGVQFTMGYDPDDGYDIRFHAPDDTPIPIIADVLCYKPIIDIGNGGGNQ